MAKGCLTFNNMTFFYEGSHSPVFDRLSVQFGTGWTGIIGPNGAGKTTLLRLACGNLRPLSGQIISPDRVIYCPQRTDDPPEEFGAFMDATDALGCSLRGQLRIEADWVQRWETLSHGERKRVQIGVALWREPNVLAIDEPTNHIDREARVLLLGTLRAFPGIGLLVSHDRELLDELCRQCLFVEPPTAVMYPGGYTEATAIAKANEEQVRRVYEQQKEEVKRLHREASNRRREAARADRMRSKRGLHPRDRDAKGKRDLARMTGKDGQAGRKLRQMEGRVDQAQETLEGMQVKRRYRLGIAIHGEQASRDVLLRIPAGFIELGEHRRLEFPELMMDPEDRVAVVGPNGAGKSTLIRHIVGQLRLPEDRVVYLAQEIDRETGQRVINEVRRLPREPLGVAMTVISCLGSRPERLIQTDDPSPGELRKLMLALGMARSPQLIVMDEPTNHLDLPSIECLETALADCESALLLVSHDMRFLGRLAHRWWEISADDSGNSFLHVKTYMGSR